MDLVKVNALIDELKIEVNKPDTPPVNIRYVKNGEDIQFVLDNLNGATDIRIQPGTYIGNFKTRKHDLGSVLIRADSDLPERRIGPADTPLLVKFQIKDGLLPALTADLAPAASNYTFQGIEFPPNTAHPERTVVYYGAFNPPAGIGSIPENIKFDRCYFHGHPDSGGLRGLGFNVNNGTVNKCYFEKYFYTGFDSQAICINVGGPYNILDSYLEAAGENFMAGGTDITIQDLLAHDIVFDSCDFFKPLEWKNKPGTVKNLFEIKEAVNVIVNRCRFTNCWKDAQAGHGIVFTIRNTNGKAPWSTIKNVTFQNNVVSGVETYGINTLGLDDAARPSIRGDGLNIINNYIQSGYGIQILNGFQNMKVRHNTIMQPSSLLNYGGLDDIVGFEFTDNVVQSGAFGAGSEKGLSPAKPILDAYNHVSGYVFDHNVIEKVTRIITWPVGNYLLAKGTLPALIDPSGQYLGTEASSDGKRLGYSAV